MAALHAYQFDFQQPEVARSNRFIMEKMNTAESRQSTTSTPQTIQSGIPVPQMRAMTLVRSLPMAVTQNHKPIIMPLYFGGATFVTKEMPMGLSNNSAKVSTK